MYRKKHIITFLIAAFLMLTAAVCGSDNPLWERLEDLQYNSYAPGLRFLTKKYGDIFEMDEYEQIASTLPEYQGMSFEVEFNENTFQYEENFLIQYRRDEIENCLQGMLLQEPCTLPAAFLLVKESHFFSSNFPFPQNIDFGIYKPLHLPVLH